MVSVDEIKTSVGRLIKESYADFKAVWPRLIGAGALMFATVIAVLAVELTLMGVAGGFTERPNFLIYLVFPVVMILHLGIGVLTCGMQIAFSKICLKLARKEQVEIISELKNCPKLIIPYLLSSFCLVPIVAVGVLCFILPGIYLALRLCLYTVAVADGYGPIDALKKSFEITRGRAIEILVVSLFLQIACFVLLLLPFINLFAMLFLALPFVAFFWARYYSALESEPEGKRAEIEFPPNRQAA